MGKPTIGLELFAPFTSVHYCFWFLNFLRFSLSHPQSFPILAMQFCLFKTKVQRARRTTVGGRALRLHKLPLSTHLNPQFPVFLQKRKRERESERERQGERDRQREREQKTMRSRQFHSPILFQASTLPLSPFGSLLVQEKERGKEGKRERGKGKWERGKVGKRESGKEGKRRRGRYTGMAAGQR